MGAIGLHREDSYVSRQAAVGKKARMYVEGPLDYASAMVRALSEKEGLVAVARNPVTASYLKAKGALGAITMCIELGYAMARHIEHELGFDPLRAEYVGEMCIRDRPESMKRRRAARLYPGPGKQQHTSYALTSCRTC